MQYNGQCYSRFTASVGRECRRSVEGESKTVMSDEESVENPRVRIEPVSCLNAMCNTMVGVTGD